MTAKISGLSFLALALLLPLPLRSDDPKPDAPPNPCVTDLTLEQLDNPPERKTKYELVEEPTKIPLNIKLVDQKYAANFDIVLPIRSGSPFNPNDRGSERGRSLGILSGSESYRDAVALHSIYGTYVLAPNLGDGNVEPVSKSLERMLARIPAERLPTKEDLACFLAPECDRLVTTSGLSPVNVKERHFRILAATPEQAERRARTLLTILDQGFSRPIQLLLHKRREVLCQQLAEHRQKLAAAEQKQQDATAELKKLADYTPDTLPALRVQQFQSEIELTGLRAKVGAYEKLLAKAQQGTPRFQQLDEAKEATEVDLASCEARRVMIGEIIGKVKRLSELAEERAAASAAKALEQTNIQNVARYIQLIDEETIAFGPVRLVDDQVTISEVEWVRAPEFDSGIGVSP